MSIRIRLTLWYIFLLGIILIIFSTLLYVVLKVSLHSQIDKNLQDRAQQVSTGIKAQTIDIEGWQKGLLYLPPPSVFSSPATFIQLVLADGKIILTSDNLGKQHIPLHDKMLAENLNGMPTFKTVIIDSVPLRIYSAPIIVGPHIVGAVQVGQSLKEIENTLHLVLIFLTGGTVGTLILAAMVGAFLVRKTLQPIEQINQTANQIVGGQDLKQRLPAPKTPDEVGQLTETINNMLQRLDNFFQAQVRLSADVSHELRTPLTAIRGNVDLLRRGAASHPDELNEALAAIDGELNRMSRLVADLLLLSQADAGLSLRMGPVELDTIILDVYRQARLMASEVNIQLGHEDQAVVQGDTDRLRQLLINLVTNAIKHTPTGGTVTLSLYREPEWVRITVADTGRGIVPTDLPHIFDRFYRAQNNGQTSIGLGLSIAQWIAEAHHGQITVTSEVGQGSVFTLWLPTKNEAGGATSPKPNQI
ncbi:MAG: HAMP domain-containing histidine kinase [Anaerolineae bacterium]|nr:HAMP domain-containing histidine kinase [Anaerolineae bacterium]